MSEKLYVRPRLPERRSVTRRTALRGAAWTAPAITVAVAAPNIAAQSLVPPPITTSASSVVKGKKTLTWTFTLTCEADLDDLTVIFDGVKDATGLKVTSSPGDTEPWDGSGTSTRTRGLVSANTSLTITAVFTRGSNGNQVTGITADFFSGTSNVSRGTATVTV